MFGYKFWLALLLAVVLGVFYKENVNVLFNFLKNIRRASTTDALFTSAELKLFNGINKPELYLGILGHIFDVSKGHQHYGPNQEYHVFIGRDATRSFVTGKFEEAHLTDDVIGLNSDELRTINHWFKFYKKAYKKVGKLIGRYYNNDGRLTAYGREIKKLIKEAEKSRDDEQLLKLKYPPCNIEWDPALGTRVWCTTRSGGVERMWVGVPRQFFEPQSKNNRCACIEDTLIPDGNIKEYEGCDKKSESCFIR